MIEKNIKLVISIGNPLAKYAKTRHNAGHLILDILEKSHKKISNPEMQIDFAQAKFLKSDTFMNESGGFVSRMCKYYKVSLEDILIIHDDLDIKLGEYKLQIGKSPKGHNGILDIEEKVGSKNFLRLRIGIENRTTDQRKYMLGRDYVLDNFSNDELNILQNLFI